MRMMGEQSKNRMGRPMRKSRVQVQPREFVERIARIIGPGSAAQAALDEADRRGGEVLFVVAGTCWYVLNKEDVL